MNLYLQMPKIIILEISCLALLKAGIDRVKNHMYLNFDVKSLYLIYICGLRYVIRNFFFSVKNLLVDIAFWPWCGHLQDILFLMTLGTYE